MDINNARQKITEESQKIGSSIAVFVEEHLNSLCTTDEVATRVIAKGKSLSGCIKEITDAARKKAANGVACLNDEEVAEIINDYYGLNSTERKATKAAQDDVIDIFDLM